MEILEKMNPLILHTANSLGAPVALPNMETKGLCV